MMNRGNLLPETGLLKEQEGSKVKVEPGGQRQYMELTSMEEDGPWMERGQIW